jgi:hypothetical protein
LDRPDLPAGQEQLERSPLATRHRDLAMSATVQFGRQHRPCPATERPPKHVQYLEIGRSSAAPPTGNSLNRHLMVDGVDNKANGRFCRLAGMGMAQPWWYSLPQSGVPSWAIRVRMRAVSTFTSRRLSASAHFIGELVQLDPANLKQHRRREQKARCPIRKRDRNSRPSRRCRVRCFCRRLSTPSAPGYRACA